MSEQYRSKFSNDDNATDVLPAMIGRGAGGDGLTLKEIRRRIQAKLDSHGLGNARWNLRRRFVPNVPKPSDPSAARKEKISFRPARTLAQWREKYGTLRVTTLIDS